MRVNVYRPDGIVRHVEFDQSVPEEPTYRSWPDRPEDWKGSLIARIADRVHKLWQEDRHHPWHGVEHFQFGLIYYYEPKNMFFCSMNRILFEPMWSEFCYFELTPAESSGWYEAEWIEPPGQETQPIRAEGPKKGMSLKVPSIRDIECYRLKHLKGAETTQAGIAFEVYGDRSKQSQVSRSLARAEAWIKAGNVFPDLGDSKPKTHLTDPRNLDKGPPRRGQGNRR